MRISDWSSDVCSSDLQISGLRFIGVKGDIGLRNDAAALALIIHHREATNLIILHLLAALIDARVRSDCHQLRGHYRSEEHTSELQSLMRISYAVFCLKKTHRNMKSRHRQSRLYR